MQPDLLDMQTLNYVVAEHQLSNWPGGTAGQRAVWLRALNGNIEVAFVSCNIKFSFEISFKN